jgi:hypothetical protein
MEVVSVREFAKRVGVSLAAIQKGIRNGRIEAIVDEATGKTKGIDYDTQASAWTDNAKAPGRRPNTEAGGRPRKDGKPPAQPKTNGGKREGEVSEYLEGQPHGGALKRSEKAPPPAGQMTMAEVQRARELVKLQLDNLKLKESQGELVNLVEVRVQGSKLAAGVISALYNIPDRVSDEIAGMTDPHQIAKLLISEIDQAVEDLRRAYGAS